MRLFLLTFCAGMTIALPASGTVAYASRVVLLDALVLTPALERSNSRLGIEQAVMAVVRGRGWEPVSVTTDCKDLGCAAAVAASAKAMYVLILSGRFVPDETYAADVGASLWRDGSVVASRTETDEEADAEKTPAGMETFFRCGPPSGACTTKILTVKLQQYATKLIGDEDAARARRAAEAGPPAAAALAAHAPASPTPIVPSPLEAKSGTSKVVGWSLVGAGALMLAGGGVLWAANNSDTDCHGVAGCRREWRTHGAAIATGVAGILAIGGGVALLVINRESSSLALYMQPTGVVLGGIF